VQLRGKKIEKHIKKVMVNLLAAIAVKCRTVEDEKQGVGYGRQVFNVSVLWFGNSAHTNTCVYTVGR